jgi:predicted acetyltransferase
MMKLRLVKPDLTYYEGYYEMMAEWQQSNTQIAPWFLSDTLPSFDEFAHLVQMLDDCEHGLVDKKFSSTTSYFVLDENDRLVGAASLRHYLTVEGFHSWGHIGYGVRPSERRKGYAVQILQLVLEQAKKRGIYQVLIGVHDSNIASWKTVERCGGILENTVPFKDEKEPIRRYWIHLS